MCFHDNCCFILYRISGLDCLVLIVIDDAIKISLLYQLKEKAHFTSSKVFGLYWNSTYDPRDEKNDLQGVREDEAWMWSMQD